MFSATVTQNCEKKTVGMVKERSRRGKIYLNSTGGVPQKNERSKNKQKTHEITQKSVNYEC